MQNRHFFVLDFILLILVAAVAFTSRFEGWGWWADWHREAIWLALLIVPLKLAIFHAVGIYRRLWRYASVAELEIVLVASAVTAGVTLLAGTLVLPALGVVSGRIPLSVLLIDSILTPAVITIPRIVLRSWARRELNGRKSPASGRRALIAGAGDAGGMIAAELLSNPQLGIVPVGFLDDDPFKRGLHLRGLRVFGPLSTLAEHVKRHEVDEVITAMPSAPGAVIRELVKVAATAGVNVRTIPGLYEILSGSKSVSTLRQIEIQDLLRREPIETDLEEVGRMITGRVVLVTGAGGSIGSELCRQIAQLSPARIVALGRGENSVFEILQELQVTYPHIDVAPAIVDVRDERRLDAVFAAHHPHAVFHAAAHKHVPLMEASVDEAILNNVVGTQNVAECCSIYGAERLVLISTDKAVRPTSIMGATKRVAEGVVHAVADREQKNFVSVRFGNVLGSRGSVVPTFMRQIAAGGPVTITDPEMRRYFMTIPEAVQLVLQAAVMGRGGETFVLDMGEPVKIVDLATDLIRLSGLEPGTDVEIKFTGARPGEKLYEELFFGSDVATPTVHPKVLRARDTHFPPSMALMVDRLAEAAWRAAPT
ncbi:MAG: polysaccharide biosynthesis protein, partial [Gemmatimonadaceae bacterium]|nr:polysaccharide biosynthesis protein [Gemmatimonadaceae bacterium]